MRANPAIHLLIGGRAGAGLALPALYWTYARCWFWLGVPAFVALLGVYWLMVAKPAL